MIGGFILILFAQTWAVITYLLNKISEGDRDVKTAVTALQDKIVTRSEYERDAGNTQAEIRAMRQELNSKFDMLFTALIKKKESND
jgi:glutamine synthetase adenylyltransferase